MHNSLALSSINNLKENTKGIDKRPDTVYIEDKTLVVVKEGEVYEFSGLIIKASSLFTTLKRGDSDNRFYLIYDYSGSFMKRKIILYMTCKKKSIYINKKFNILFDSRNNLNFGWVTLYGEIPLDENINIDYIEDLDTLVNYDIKRNEDFGYLITIFTHKDTIVNNYKPDTLKIPAIYSDGTFLGHYEFNNTKNALFLDFENMQNLNFHTREYFGNKVSFYNNIAYYLEQSGAYSEAVVILEKIIKKYPDRVVAYINLGDAYWGLNDTGPAIKAYEKYMDLMISNGKEDKIPRQVTDRVNAGR